LGIFRRGLDAYGFSDLKTMTAIMRSLTSTYDLNGVAEEGKFKFDTPAEAMDTMHSALLGVRAFVFAHYSGYP
jgi:hypothetical protein